MFERIKEIPPLDKVLGRKTVEDDPKKGAEAIKAALLAYSVGYEAKAKISPQPVAVANSAAH